MRGHTTFAGKQVNSGTSDSECNWASFALNATGMVIQFVELLKRAVPEARNSLGQAAMPERDFLT